MSLYKLLIADIPFIDDPETSSFLDFAVFGKFQEVTIVYYENIDSTGEERIFGDMENSIMIIHASLPKKSMSQLEPSRLTLLTLY